MSRIFLSHSSIDEREAVALKGWLVQNGWDDVFLDLDPQRGLLAGERWQEALRRAADRCEAVVFIVTPAWAKSKWCLAEFLLAKSLNKRIFGAILKAVELSELPVELTAEWQLCHLIGDGPKSPTVFSHKGQPQQIEFLTDGLTRLRLGLENAGLDARYFPWPPPDEKQRPPYRGLVPLDEKDAAIYFGRDAQIVRGLDALRGMQATGVETLFVILGPSGCGKSSFLRAGLIPRLKRDDRHFLALEIIRPERHAITGERGLANALHKACVAFGLNNETLGGIKTALTGAQDSGQMSRLLNGIQHKARERLRVNAEDIAPPTLLLSVDQAEELFNPDASDEARRLLALIGAALRNTGTERPSMIVAFTIRSDRYEPLQTADELARLKSRVFDDLKPMPSQQFKEVITGPARRSTQAGNRLEIKPDLVDRLLSDCAQGADTLPLLSLTLSRLFQDYGSRGDLSLEEYHAMGGMGSVVNSEVGSVLARDETERRTQLRQLHAAFIPWLATINPQTDEPMRRVARYADLPAEGRPLIDDLARRRLLLIDQREGEKVIEVAHEALLRQWGDLAGWLQDEREDLKLAHALEQATQDWDRSGCKESWLWVGERLANAEILAAKAGFRNRLDGCGGFLLASRREENARREAEERSRKAELEAAQKLAAAEKKRAEDSLALAQSERKARIRQRYLTLSVSVLLVAAVVATWLISQEQKIARSREVASAANNQINHDPELSVSLAAAAVKIARTEEAENILRESLIALHHSHLRTLLSGHEGAVRGASFSPIGEWIVTASEDNRVLVWEMESGKPLFELEEGKRHKAIVYSAVFDPSGDRIVTASKDGTARIWDARKGKMVVELSGPKGHKGPVRCAAFNHDGTRVVTASEDKTVRVWDAKFGGMLFELEGEKQHTGIVYSAAFSPDGERIVTASDDRTARVWEARTGKWLVTLTGEMGHKDSVRCAAFSPNGMRIVTASKDKTAKVWDAQTGKLVFELADHTDWVHSAAFSPDGRHIATACGDKKTRIWGTTAGQKLLEFGSHRGTINGVAFRFDGKFLVTASGDMTARVWELDVEKKFIEIAGEKGHKGPIRQVAFSLQGDRIVTASEDQTAYLWDAKTGERLFPLKHWGWVTSAAFSPDGSRVVTSGADPIARVWDSNTGEPRLELKGHRGWVYQAAFSPQGDRIVTAGKDGTARIWDAGRGIEIRVLVGHEGRVSSAAFHPQGDRIITAGQDGTARIWEASTGKELLKFGEQKGWLSCAAFSPDGSRAVTAGAGGSVRIWDPATGKPLAGLVGHIGWVFSAAFNPRGDRVVTAAADGTTRVWEADSGRLLVTLKGHTGWVYSAAFSPDGEKIVTAGEDKTARISGFELCCPFDVLIIYTRGIRELTEREKEVYLHQVRQRPEEADPSIRSQAWNI